MKGGATARDTARDSLKEESKVNDKSERGRTSSEKANFDRSGFNGKLKNLRETLSNIRSNLDSYHKKYNHQKVDCSFKPLDFTLEQEQPIPPSSSRSHTAFLQGSDLQGGSNSTKSHTSNAAFGN